MDNNNVQSSITKEEFDYAQDIIKRLSGYYDGKVVGQQNLKFALVASIIADGHVLIESVPGLAKTTAAKTISDAVDGKFSRIQCTPDLLPSDIIGTQVYNQATGKFDTTLGPVFANFVLLDEINRSSAKTQSAMLEAMQERQVTIGGATYKMPDDVFIVIATQNPIEQEGTYLLSEAQTDRFIIKEKITYPSPDEEAEILNRIESGVIKKTPAVLTIQDVDYLQKIAENRDWMLVSDHEINSEKQPRTYDSLCWLKQQGYQCSLLFGSDKLPELKTGWLHVEEIAKEFGIVCMSRNDEDVNQIIASDPYLSSLQAWITILPVPEEYQTISSTRVRKLFLEKKYEEIEKYVPAELNGLREYD